MILTPFVSPNEGVYNRKTQPSIAGHDSILPKALTFLTTNGDGVV